MNLSLNKAEAAEEVNLGVLPVREIQIGMTAILIGTVLMNKLVTIHMIFGRKLLKRPKNKKKKSKKTLKRRKKYLKKDGNSEEKKMMKLLMLRLFLLLMKINQVKMKKSFQQ